MSSRLYNHCSVPLCCPIRYMINATSLEQLGGALLISTFDVKVDKVYEKYAYRIRAYIRGA